MKKYLVLVIGILFLFSMTAYASMMGGGDGSDSGMMGGSNGTGMMGNGSGMMSSSGMSGGTFGMTNGMAGAPIVGEDGTAYLMSTVRSGDTSGMSFQSVIAAVSPQGNGKSITLQGIISRPVVEGNLLVATASLPNFNNYNMMGNNGFNGNAPTPGQSVLYAVTLPITDSTQPAAISLDGNFASIPVIANSRIYITTSDYGTAMMGSFGNLQNGQAGKSYLYIFNLDGTLASKTEL